MVLRFVHSQDIREIRGPNAFKTRLKCTCQEIALSVTRQTCTWICPVLAVDLKDFRTVIPGELGPLREFISGAVVSGRMVIRGIFKGGIGGWGM